MNIVADRNIPALSTLLSGAGNLHFFSERTPSKELLAKADALLVRSITQVNEELLKLAPNLSFVASATIGTEHIDTELLTERGITFAHAPGANASSVGEYVLCAVLQWLDQKEIDSLADLDVAIVGAGHTGQAAGQRLQALGMNVHYYDPPLSKKGEKAVHDHWQRVITADIISCHVPLTRGGDCPTHHLFEHTALQSLHENQLLINASRGAVIDNSALLERAQQGEKPFVVLDVWEGEPEVLEPLVDCVDIATPHIAGHSLEGKIGGAIMVADALLAHCQLKSDYDKNLVLPRADWPALDAVQLLSISSLLRWVNQHYDIMSDDARFRRYGMTPEGFDSMRKKYRKESPRREFINQVVACHNSEQYIQFLKLGFDAQQTDR